MKSTVQHRDGRGGGRESGFSMLEVLVAITITAFGLLSIAGLMLASLRANQTAHLRATATQQAEDMVERVRANLPGFRAGNYDAIGVGNGGTPSDNCKSAICTAENMAAFDRFEWNSANAALLPEGIGMTDLDPDVAATDPMRPRRVIVGWTEREMAGAQDDACPDAIKQANRRCFVTRFRP